METKVRLKLPKGVVVSIVGRSKLEKDEIDGSDGGGDEEDLHGRVVHGDERRQQVQVAGHEHHRE